MSIRSDSAVQKDWFSSLESTSRFIPSASPFLSQFTSSSTSQLISVIISTLVIHHSFTLSLQAQNLPFQQILPTVDFFYLPDCLHDNGTDWTGPITLIILFLVSHFNFLFVPCGRLSWLPVSFLLHVKHTLSYCIVSYTIVSYRNPKSDMTQCCSLHLLIIRMNVVSESHYWRLLLPTWRTPDCSADDDLELLLACRYCCQWHHSATCGAVTVRRCPL